MSAFSSRPLRLFRLWMLRTTRRLRWWAAPLWRLNTWMILGAAAVVGFEGLEALLGTFLLAPELLPFALLAIAVYWVFRDRLGRLLRRVVRYVGRGVRHVSRLARHLRRLMQRREEKRRREDVFR